MTTRGGYGRGSAMAHARYTGRVWMRRIAIAVYLLIGLLVANAENYLGERRLDSIEGIAEAFLAVVLWPLVLLGVSMRL